MIDFKFLNNEQLWESLLPIVNIIGEESLNSVKGYDKRIHQVKGGHCKFHEMLHSEWGVDLTIVYNDTIYIHYEKEWNGTEWRLNKDSI